MSELKFFRVTHDASGGYRHIEMDTPEVKKVMDTKAGFLIHLIPPNPQKALTLGELFIEIAKYDKDYPETAPTYDHMYEVLYWLSELIRVDAARLIRLTHEKIFPEGIFPTCPEFNRLCSSCGMSYCPDGVRNEKD